MIASVEVLHSGQYTEWMDVLRQARQHDFYYLPAYHAQAEQRGEGEARLFVYHEGPYVVALPLLLRPLATAPGLTEAGAGWWDATSVYGYAGPVASHQQMPESVLHSFRSALRAMLEEQRVVSLFARLHPLIPQRYLLDGLGEYVPVGQTVSIDLTMPPETQWAGYRQNHKRDIAKLQRLGVSVVYDWQRQHLGSFVSVYHDTMRRVQATAGYFFDYTYFEQITSSSEGLHLFVCMLEDQVICGGVFGLCDHIVQYHLGGTRNDFLKLAPMKLLMHGVRLWANERGARVFHLGGGVGAQEDALFQFKAGFSDRRHEFAIWRWTVLPDVYERLCAAQQAWNMRHGLHPVSAEYYPRYRCPTTMRQNGAV